MRGDWGTGEAGARGSWGACSLGGCILGACSLGVGGWGTALGIRVLKVPMVSRWSCTVLAHGTCPPVVMILDSWAFTHQTPWGVLHIHKMS